MDGDSGSRKRGPLRVIGAVLAGLLAGVGGAVTVAQLAGFSDLSVSNLLRGFSIGPESEEAQFLYGEWCSATGERQRFARAGRNVAVTNCFADDGVVCGEGTLGAAGPATVRNAVLGWEEGHLVYQIEGSDLKIVVGRKDDDRIVQRLDFASVFSEWSRCSPVATAETTAAAPPGDGVPKYSVDPWTPPRPLVVRAKDSRFRLHPFVRDEASILAKGSPGDLLDVIGLSRQDDFDWYQVRISGGRVAFIRADLTMPQPDQVNQSLAGLYNSAGGRVPAASGNSVPVPGPPKLSVPPSRRSDAPSPAYPQASMLRGEEGTVKLGVCVHADGTVSDPQLVNSSGHSRLDRAVLRWVASERLNPATTGGQPVEFCGYQLEYIFELRDER